MKLFKLGKTTFLIFIAVLLLISIKSFDSAFASNDHKEIEILLVEILDQIYGNNLDLALENTENLTKKFPNFALAHMIKGDLISAKYRSLEQLGATAILKRTQVSDLIEEAIARTRRAEREPPRSSTPVYLIKTPSQFRHVLVVDASAATLYVYENQGNKFEYVADFYASIGKKGVGKEKEGDKKTPLGVYKITKKIPSEKVSNFYGAGAFPINYPNKWDRLNGKGGYGIWLHGSPWETYSRPPQASDGCVVLNNQDFDRLSKFINPIKGTPVIIAERIEWSSKTALSQKRDTLINLISNWRRDWESLDTEKYLSNYSEEFFDGKLSYRSWAQKKRKINSHKKWIKVKIDNVSMSLYPGNKEMLVVNFTQKYSSNNLSDTMSKLQYWIKEKSGWRILYEGNG